MYVCTGKIAKVAKSRYWKKSFFAWQFSRHSTLSQWLSGCEFSRVLRFDWSAAGRFQVETALLVGQRGTGEKHYKTRCHISMNIKRSSRTFVTIFSSIKLTRKIEFAVGFRYVYLVPYTFAQLTFPVGVICSD